MDIFSLDDINIEDIMKLLENEAEENVHLEYKSAEALQSNDRGKNEITKDVSSFANSDGGIIIYGISEKNHKPESISPVDGTNFSKERLEQIISNIQPHIPGLRIFPIRIHGDFTKSIYVVKIPRSAAAPHMATDHKYYKRFNFQSVAMEDYEVKDLIYRVNKPELEIERFNYWENTMAPEEYLETFDYHLCITIRNSGQIVCSNYKAVFTIYTNDLLPDEYSITAYSSNISSLSPTYLENGFKRLSLVSKEPIFPGEILDFEISFKFGANADFNIEALPPLELTLWYEGGFKRYSYNMDSYELKPLERNH